jgi:hypothetical protein
VCEQYRRYVDQDDVRETAGRRHQVYVLLCLAVSDLGTNAIHQQ